MEIKITTQHLLNLFTIIASIIFVGVSIEAGGFLYNSFYTMFFNPVGANYFWNHLDLSGLYEADHGHFLAETTLINIVAVLRAIMFYVIVKFLYDKKLDLFKPFSESMRRFILLIAYLALGISFFSAWGSNYTEWLISKGIKMPALQDLRLAGADVWSFMSIVLFVIAQIFKRGIEIQSENDLTV